MKSNEWCIWRVMKDGTGICAQVGPDKWEHIGRMVTPAAAEAAVNHHNWAIWEKCTNAA